MGVDLWGLVHSGGWPDLKPFEVGFCGWFRSGFGIWQGFVGGCRVWMRGLG